MVRRAALFDMDRTLVRIDTATLYVRYQRDRGEATWRDVVIPLLAVAHDRLAAQRARHGQDIDDAS